VDVLMNALNFLRFLLVRDKPHSRIGIHEPKVLRHIKNTFVTPLTSSLDALLEEYHDLLSEEEQKKRICLLTKHGFPRLSPDDMYRASTATLSTLFLLKDVLDRVRELLEGDRD